MAQLTPELFRDYFGGSWSGKVSKDGEFQRVIVFNWPEAFGKYSSFGTEAGMIVPQGLSVQDDTRQIAISGWRSDIRRWYSHWYNEYGGFGELQWVSQHVVEGITILHGILNECKQESDDPTLHIARCELYDQDHFRYSIQSSSKGLTEIVATRIQTSKELTELLKKQTKSAKRFKANNKV